MVAKRPNADMALRFEELPWSCNTTAGHRHLHVVCSIQRGDVVEHS